MQRWQLAVTIGHTLAPLDHTGIQHQKHMFQEEVRKPNEDRCDYEGEQKRHQRVVVGIQVTVRRRCRATTGTIATR